MGNQTNQQEAVKMLVKKRKVKHPPSFCFCCGRTLETEEYVIDFGSSGATFELCKGCLKRLKAKTEKVLEAK